MSMPRRCNFVLASQNTEGGSKHIENAKKTLKASALLACVSRLPESTLKAMKRLTYDMWFC